MSNESQWPEDKADWPHAVGVVQGGVSQTASVVVNDRESADLASAVQNVINKAEQKTGIRPDVVVTKPHHAALQSEPNTSRVANQEQSPCSILTKTTLEQQTKGIFCVVSTDGKSACIDIVDGKLVLRGDLPTDEAAEIFMTAMAKSIQNLQERQVLQMQQDDLLVALTNLREFAKDLAYSCGWMTADVEDAQSIFDSTIARVSVRKGNQREQ